MKQKRAFTLVEILVVMILLSLASAVLYRLMSGAFSQFFKSQTKLTNLRAASIILEHLKKDLRLAVVPLSTAEKPVIDHTSGKLKFSFYIKDHISRKKVVYSFNRGIVERQINGKKRKINIAKVSDLKIEELKGAKGEMLAISIIVDKDKDLQKRSGSSKGNKVELQAFLFPRFFNAAISKEDKYWSFARNYH